MTSRPFPEDIVTTVRCKMRCVKSERTEYSDGTPGYSVVLVPVMEGSEENKEFFRWTPGGTLQIGTLNETAGKEFVEGVEYYVDLTRSS